MTVITEPGVYPGLPEDEYHLDPVPDGSLSVTGAKKLLAEGGPAVFDEQLTRPPASTKDQELGTVAHTLVLGTGRGLHEVHADSWRTKAAQEEADKARADGKVPLLSHDVGTVQDMAAALRQHPVAAALLTPGRGTPEASVFWQDEQFKIWRRCRFDWMPDSRIRPYPVVADYKTAKAAGPTGFAKAVADYRYDMQAEWYCDGYEVIYGVRPAFIFIAQEKTPPYLVGVYQLDDEAARIGRAANERAMEIYRDCTDAGKWPGYSDEIETISLPRWARAREDYYA